MFGRRHPPKPDPDATPAPKVQPSTRPPRDIGREDADSPTGIPILPPRNDGS